MQIVLIEPEIPQNTGTIARLCAGWATPLHLVGHLGFSLDDRHLKRAGLDYWPQVEIHRHRDVRTWCDGVVPDSTWCFSARAGRPIEELVFAPTDLLVFGSESKGFPPFMRERFASRLVNIPFLPAIRSINLANAVSMVLFEALRQTGGLAEVRALAERSGKPQGH